MKNNEVYKKVCSDLELTEEQRMVIFAYAELPFSKHNLKCFLLPSDHIMFKEMDSETLEAFSFGLTELTDNPINFESEQLDKARLDIAFAVNPF